MAKSKEKKENNELPLNEDYREMGREFEYESDKDRETARKSNRNKKGGKDN